MRKLELRLLVASSVVATLSAAGTWMAAHPRHSVPKADDRPKIYLRISGDGRTHINGVEMSRGRAYAACARLGEVGGIVHLDNDAAFTGERVRAQALVEKVLRTGIILEITIQCSGCA